MTVNLGQLLTEAKAKQTARLAADRLAAQLKKDEDAILALLQVELEAIGLDNLEVGELSCRIEEKTKPYIVDWSELEGYIRENGALDLLHKRLTETAVKLRWEDGIQIPGVGISHERKLKLK